MILLGAIFVKSLVVATIALVTAWALRDKSAASRSLVWKAAFVTFACILPVQMSGPIFRIPLLRPSVDTVSQISSEELSPATPESTISQPADKPEPPREIALIPIWASVAILLLAYQSIGYFQVRRIIANSKPFTSDQVRINSNAEPAAPIACGLLRPFIVFPPTAEDWPRERIEAAAAHERAHIDRSDLWWSFIAALLCSIYWFNPFARDLSRWATLPVKKVEIAEPNEARQSGSASMA
jgi:beta-lactamase regulating signal transducer with metallopeptidase domain